jgi:glycosyltransferase involved in cell wall biosynthesis
MSAPRYSIVVPVYNRPDEVNELLASLAQQTRTDFEIIIVEDGSSVPCYTIVENFRPALDIKYFSKNNEGPGPARNFGFRQARGEYFVVFDSDCIIPQGYFAAVDDALEKLTLDAWGGPDKAHESFTVLQQAMGYTMASVLTTGGIRGGKQRLGWFQPRSFNMGISRKVFEVTHGFAFSRFAEDIELSFRMRDAGFNVGLIDGAYVYHKRRTSFTRFFKQVFNFGKGRIMISRVHRGGVKITHWFPTVFTLGLLSLPLLPLIHRELFNFAGAGLILYFSLIFLHALAVTRNLTVALYSVPSAVIQLTGYGIGFLSEWFKTRALR